MRKGVFEEISQVELRAQILRGKSQWEYFPSTEDGCAKVLRLLVWIGEISGKKKCSVRLGESWPY
jgi:hypothetical protein